MRALIVTNMWPSPATPALGSFVRDQVDALRRIGGAGLELQVFDFPPSSMVTGRRNASTVAPQALFLLNHPFVRERAAGAASRLLQDRHEGAEARIKRAYLRALSRPPTERETEIASKVLLANRNDLSEAWTEIFHALFACLDFRYVN